MQGITKTATALAIFALLGCAGCIQLPLVVSVPPASGSDQRNAGQFVAGAYKVEITPVPGVPLGGYSIESKGARGFWTRLYARALYLRDAGGNPLVLVSADLGGIGGGLSDRVVELLHANHGLYWIGREHLVVSGTHTHHGPGNFYSSGMMNGTISASTGFDPALFRFLAERIAEAIHGAWLAAKPAELLTSDPAFTKAPAIWKLDGLVRNRSLPAYLLNPRAAQKLDKDVSSSCTLAEGRTDTRACQAVAPEVQVLAIRQSGSNDPVAVAAFVAMHPTVMHPRLEVYSSDLFGVADVRLEEQNECDALADDPVVAFFNGAEGDVSAAWQHRDRNEAIALGGLLEKKICQLLADLEPVPTPTLHARFERVTLGGESFTEEASFVDASGAAASGSERSTVAIGHPGAAAVGGAQDGRSVLHEFWGHRDGFTLPVRQGHGAKSPVGKVSAMGVRLNPLALFMRINPPPREAAIGVYKILSDDLALVIVAAPGELTTAMGQRLRELVWQKLPSGEPKPAGPGRILVTGLANEYVGYFVTPEEYEAQYYEGAMTLFGQGSGVLLAQQIGELGAVSKGTSHPPTSGKRYYWPGPRKEFSAERLWSALYHRDGGLSDLLVHESSGHDPRRDLPVYCWRDKVPRLEGGDQTCERANPEVRVQTKKSNETSWQPLDDNFGLDFATAVTAVGKAPGEGYSADWCAVWLGAPGHKEETRIHDFRFEVDPLVGNTLRSATFALVDPDPDGPDPTLCPECRFTTRFLQQPTPRLAQSPPSLLQPPGQCTVP